MSLTAAPDSLASRFVTLGGILLVGVLMLGCRKQSVVVEAPPKAATTARSAPPVVVTSGNRTVKYVPLVCKRALDGLTEFLDAKDFPSRLKYMQSADKLEATAKAYYASHPAGPIEVDEIQYLRHDEYPKLGNGMYVVFVIFSRNWEFGFPVMVEVTPEGARVDWEAFVEFKDDLLNKYLSNFTEEPGQFHVGIQRTHYFDESIPNLDQKESFSITSPMANIKGFVFVPKGSRVAASLAKTITWDKEATFVVVDLKWRTEGKAKWVELLGVPRLNWYSMDK